MENFERRNALGAVVFFEKRPDGTYQKTAATRPLRYFDALTIYAETPNPASQLVGGNTEEEVFAAIKDITKKMANIDWVEEYLTPYL